ncbi:unnamed protein product [Cunninghamella blakesleeana]
MIIKSFLTILLLLVVDKFLLVSSLPIDGNTSSDGTVFHSKLYPDFSVTYKTPNHCDPTVKQYSGYIDVAEDQHYFFWFFESRQQPEKAPVTLWLNGGPGSSSMFGLWEELGPCRVINNGSEAIYNEKGSWNKASNLLFIDQPSQVGLSYGNSSLSSTEGGSKYMYIFLQIFYEAFPQYKTNDFHFFGESYGGRYVPTYADYIYQQNQNKASDHFSIPLKSIGVGNGMLDFHIQVQYYEKMACDSSYGSVLDENICQTMKFNEPTCTSLTKKCYETNEDKDCVLAFTYCSNSLQFLYFLSLRSAYDVRHSNPSPEAYVNFLNKTSTLESIGAKTHFVPQNLDVLQRYQSTGDTIKSSTSHIINLLNNDIPVFMYAGDADYICSWYGIQAVLDQIEFKNQQEYRNDQLKPWHANGKEAGQIQQGGGLTFLRIYDAGHFVPTDQPEAALEMFSNHLSSTLK